MNLGLLNCRQILYHLSHQGSPMIHYKVTGWLDGGPFVTSTPPMMWNWSPRSQAFFSLPHLPDLCLWGFGTPLFKPTVNRMTSFNYLYFALFFITKYSKHKKRQISVGSHTVCPVSASLTELRVLRVHSYGSECQGFSPLCGWGMVQCVEGHVCILCGWSFGLYALWGRCKSHCCGHVWTGIMWTVVFIWLHLGVELPGQVMTSPHCCPRRLDLSSDICTSPCESLLVADF